jgi:hypothetical protein
MAGSWAAVKRDVAVSSVIAFVAAAALVGRPCTRRRCRSHPNHLRHSLRSAPAAISACDCGRALCDRRRAAADHCSERYLALGATCSQCNVVRIMSRVESWRVKLGEGKRFTRRSCRSATGLVLGDSGRSCSFCTRWTENGDVCISRY